MRIKILYLSILITKTNFNMEEEKKNNPVSILKKITNNIADLGLLMVENKKSCALSTLGGGGIAYGAIDVLINNTKTEKKTTGTIEYVKEHETECKIAAVFTGAATSFGIWAMIFGQKNDRS